MTHHFTSLKLNSRALSIPYTSTHCPISHTLFYNSHLFITHCPISHIYTGPYLILTSHTLPYHTVPYLISHLTLPYHTVSYYLTLISHTLPYHTPITLSHTSRLTLPYYLTLSHITLSHISHSSYYRDKWIQSSLAIKI